MLTENHLIIVLAGLIDSLHSTSWGIDDIRGGRQLEICGRKKYSMEEKESSITAITAVFMDPVLYGVALDGTKGLD
jgi:hypothetical protein